MDNVEPDLAGRVALITGGSRGIGLAIGTELVRRGARVCLTARKPAELAAAVEKLGAGSAVGVAGSADDAGHQDAAVARTLQEFGQLDFLVNNAAVNPQYGPLRTADLGAVRKTLEVNVIAVLGWVQAACRAGLSGAILNVASIGGLRPAPMLGAYNVSKAAVVHLTRQLAMEFGPRVRVNAIAPAVVKTTFAQVLYDGREAEVAAAYPLARLGTPEDIAALAAFLLSDAASWITGETVVIDGGLSVTDALWRSSRDLTTGQPASVEVS